MTSPVVAIADTVAELLSQAVFSMPVQVRRGYLLTRDLPMMTTCPHVTVSPVSVVSELQARTSENVDYQIAVHLSARVGAEPGNEILDNMTTLQQEIIDLLSYQRLPSQPVTCVSYVYDPLVMPEHLEQFGIYTSVVTFVYRGARRSPYA